MADEQGGPRSGSQLEAAFAMLAEEQRKLADFQRRMTEASTSVESPNKMVSATFDGRGELVKLTFLNTRYRALAPAELAELLTETLRRGRAEAFGKIDEMSGGDVLPGVRFGDLAAGKVDINEVVGSIMSTAIDLPSIARAARESSEAAREKSSRAARENGRADG